MINDSIAQTEDKQRLEWMLKRARDSVARYYAERQMFEPYSPEWNWRDDFLFEARCEVRRIKAAIRMAGKQWECERCGQRCGPEWVAAWGLRCDAECDGWLRELAR